MTICGLDLSLVATGIVAIDDTTNIIHKRTFGYPIVPKITEKKKIIRLLWITNEIIKDIKKFNVDKIGIEGYSYGSRYRREDLAELHGLVKTQLFLACNLVPVIIPCKKARYELFGKGNIKKDKVIELLKKDGKVFDDDNQADAYVIAYYNLRHTNK
jgi:Holliday junction resolvasome RuvABC endonuclease subunit